MLSRVAELIYWMARYIERAENTARLVSVTTNLILDLPRSANVGWEHIIEILGSEELFYSYYDEATEKNILKFIIADLNHTGSLMSSLHHARENARTIRDIIPRETWESINDLHLYCKSNTHSGISRRNRHTYLQNVIRGAQTITGQLAGTMYHDVGYDFLRMGRNLERADMTTRIIDVRSADLLENEHESLTPYENIQWMSVLKSLTAYQMYRRIIRLRVRRPDVLRFLLQDPRFPRAFYHAVCEVESCLANLPRNTKSIEVVGQVQKTVLAANPQKLKQDELHKFLDKLQLGLNKLNNSISKTYFLS
ncbi:alpha-E domain-containing protein [Kaarinaea lacus]